MNRRARIDASRSHIINGHPNEDAMRQKIKNRRRKTPSIRGICDTAIRRARIDASRSRIAHDASKRDVVRGCPATA